MNENRFNFLKNKTKVLYTFILSLIVLFSGFFLMLPTNSGEFYWYHLNYNIQYKTPPTSRFNNTIKFVNRTNNVNVTMKHGLVLMSWDGVQRAVFLELLYNGYLPNINKLNIYNMDCSTEYGARTVTAAQHSIMLSGYLANVTGTTTNYPVQPLEVNSLFYRVKMKKPEYYIAGLITKTRFVAIPLLYTSSDYPKFFQISGEFINLFGFDYIKSSETYFKSTYASFPWVQEPSIFEDDEVLRIAEVRDKFLYFFHVADPDEVGHQYSSYSDEYRQAIVDSDVLLGKLREKLPIGTIFIITSDHGFFGITHDNTPNTFLASNVMLKDGYEVDISPTIYDLLGVNQSFYPNLNGKSLLI